MKVTSVALLGRYLSTTVTQLAKSDTIFCTAARTSTTAASLNIDDDYDKCKPFSNIPGPTGLPYFGTLFYYKAGRLFKSANICSIMHLFVLLYVRLLLGT